MTRLIAIDPGAHGAVAWRNLEWDGYELQLGVVPLAQLGGESGIASRLRDLLMGVHAMVVIERVHAIPGVGNTKSSFAFGRSYGFLRGVLAMARASYQDVAPQTWQAGLGLPKKLQGPARKRALREIAAQRYPHLDPTLDTCDALLLLDWFSAQRSGQT